MFCALYDCSLTGLIDENGIGGTDANRFQPVDTFSEETDFFATGQQFPWHANNPNDVLGNEDCVQ